MINTNSFRIYRYSNKYTGVLEEYKNKKGTYFY